MELQAKNELSKEINQLMYKTDKSNISAVQDVIAKEMRQRKNKVSS